MTWLGAGSTAVRSSHRRQIGHDAGMAVVLLGLLFGFGLPWLGLLLGVFVVDPILRVRRPQADPPTRLRLVAIPAVMHAVVVLSIPAAWILSGRLAGFERDPTGLVRVGAMILAPTLAAWLGGRWTAAALLREVGVPAARTQRTAARLGRLGAGLAFVAAFPVALSWWLLSATMLWPVLVIVLIVGPGAIFGTILHASGAFAGGLAEAVETSPDLATVIRDGKRT